MCFPEAPPMCATMAGRIETYTHSDSVTENKGACVIHVRCESDFGARTQRFKDFAKEAAKFCYGVSASCWDDVKDVFPHMEEERIDLEEELKEKISINDIFIMKL